MSFLERTGRTGEPSEIPSDYLEIQVPDGVVLEKSMIEQDKPLAMHHEEILGEDDDFLSIGSEIWEYEIAEGREQEFLDAAKNSRMVMECIPLDDDI